MSWLEVAGMEVGVKRRGFELVGLIGVSFALSLGKFHVNFA